MRTPRPPMVVWLSRAVSSLMPLLAGQWNTRSLDTAHYWDDLEYRCEIIKINEGWYWYMCSDMLHPHMLSFLPPPTRCGPHETLGAAKAHFEENRFTWHEWLLEKDKKRIQAYRSAAIPDPPET